jgi:hypothetical protein
MAIGNAPSEIAKLVIKIGLKRASEASRIASSFGLFARAADLQILKFRFSYCQSTLRFQFD